VIQSLQRGLEILEYMAERGGAVTVSDAARHLGVDRSTGSRLLATLDRRGFVVRDLDSQRYRLGTKLLVLSKVVLDTLSVAAAGHDDVVGLVEATGEAAHLAILQGWEAVFVDHVDGRAALTINASVGDRDPLYCTAIGRALLMGLTEEEVRAVLRDVPMVAYTRKTTTSMARLLEALRTSRSQGYAYDDEERNAGVQCLAAPVRDHTGEVVAAIGISAPTSRVVLVGKETLAGQVVAAARSLSERLGFAIA
jgi:IclR family acetate operon transcriptional repressor